MINTNAIENIISRKSIRKYTEQEVPHSMIKTILDSAMSAPTAHNRRPYHFIVIKDKLVKDLLCEVNPYSTMVKESSLTIAVCGDTEVEPTMDFIHHGCAAAVQNILLTAHALGLGAVWVGVSQGAENGWDKHVSKVLQLPEHIKPISLIPIGYPDQERKVRDMYEEDKVHNNNW